ncbi:MAG: four helix bundle protein [Chlorobium sp.]|nr:four helix bundle protein [Chlorobium sp.]
MAGSQVHKLPFEKLLVWHSAKDFTLNIYGISKTFPPDERFGLTNQMNRAAVSVMSNLAEGSARTSKKDQAHFSQIAYSSLMEVACQIQLAHELGYCALESFQRIREQILELSSKINALRRSQLKEA